MKKFAWCTDIHLDFIDGPNETGRVHEEFARPLSNSGVDGVFLTGDISLANDIVRHLRILDSVVDKPIYFVLGNHDFYGGSFERVRGEVVSLCKDSKNLRYLTNERHVSLTENTAVVGHDGWYDAYWGDVARSNIVMTDWHKIEDYVNAGSTGLPWARLLPLANFSIGNIVSISRKASFEAAEHVREVASAAARDHRIVIVLTHVPPFPQVHRHNGKSGSAAAMPWYTSKLMGDALTDVAAANPQTRFEVFCGHTHGQFDDQIEENLFCHVGGAEYGNPRMIGTIQLP